MTINPTANDLGIDILLGAPVKVDGEDELVVVVDGGPLFDRGLEVCDGILQVVGCLEFNWGLEVDGSLQVKGGPSLLFEGGLELKGGLVVNQVLEVEGCLQVSSSNSLQRQSVIAVDLHVVLAGLECLAVDVGAGAGEAPWDCDSCASVDDSDLVKNKRGSLTWSLFLGNCVPGLETTGSTGSAAGDRLFVAACAKLGCGISLGVWVSIFPGDGQERVTYG